jgi:hypothetical protein
MVRDLQNKGMGHTKKFHQSYALIQMQESAPSYIIKLCLVVSAEDDG